MKRYVYLLLCCYLSAGSAQQSPGRDSGNNEISINLLYTLLEIPEITYERILSKETGIGLSLAVALNDDIEIQKGLAPFFRYYFGNNRADGFFVEANAAFYEYQSGFFPIDGSAPETELSFGLGIAGGVKLLSARGWMGMAFIGFGRRLGGSGDILDVGYPRAGISFGKRF